VIVFANEPGLAPNYPKQPNTYDGFFSPRASYYTGRTDLHGLIWGNEGLWTVNTLFSCLALIDDNYSFIPKWHPPFITKLAPEDRCHLNSMAFKDGKPEFATTMSSGDERESWRKGLPGGGTLIHIPTNEIILRDLPMPHSARLYDGKLYLLFSATGEIVCADPEKGTYEVVKQIDGFLRGMARCGDYLFICMSKLRKNSSTFKDLPIADKANQAGIIVLHLPTGALVGRIIYLASVDEIFDIQVLPNLRRPGIINTDDDTYKHALTTPETTFWASHPDRNGNAGNEKNFRTNT